MFLLALWLNPSCGDVQDNSTKITSSKVLLIYKKLQTSWSTQAFYSEEFSWNGLRQASMQRALCNPGFAAFLKFISSISSPLIPLSFVLSLSVITKVLYVVSCQPAPSALPTACFTHTHTTHTHTPHTHTHTHTHTRVRRSNTDWPALSCVWFVWADEEVEHGT